MGLKAAFKELRLEPKLLNRGLRINKNLLLLPLPLPLSFSLQFRLNFDPVMRDGDNLSLDGLQTLNSKYTEPAI